MKEYWYKTKEKFLQSIQLKVYILLGIICLTFGIGLLASLKQVGERSWVPAALDKVKSVLGLTKSKEFEGGLSISTSRYEFETIAKARKGQYQITTTDGTNIIAIERNTGLLLSLTPDGDGYKETVLSQSVFPNNVQPKSAPDNYPPLVMDLHFGLNKLLYSLVVLDKEKSCQSLVLYEVTLGNPTSKSYGEPIEHFRTPCVLDTNNTVMWAGRIANNQNTFFFSVGELRFDRSGYPKTDIFNKDDLVRSKTVFGKILAFSQSLKQNWVYSMGHRNSQGLFWDSERNQLLSTEHGPNGGDEVNFIVQGGDYGWPRVTFGKPYPKLYPSALPELNDAKNPSIGVDLKPERKGLLTGTHEGFIPPLMSWTLKDGGIGQILRVPHTSPLKDWRGDIVTAIMGQRSLHRLKLNNGAVVMDENIDVGVRIRDMLLLSNGNLTVSLDDGALFILKTEAI